MFLRKAGAIAAAGAALAFGATAGPAQAIEPALSSAASVATQVVTVGTCGDTRNVVFSGGRALWTVSCSSGSLRVSGTVTDTVDDGKCASVEAVYSNGSHGGATACSAGTTTPFEFVGPGTSVELILMLV